MGSEIVYCTRCACRLAEKDFEYEHAFRILGKPVCRGCKKGFVDALTDKERVEYEKEQSPAERPSQKIKATSSVPSAEQGSPFVLVTILALAILGVTGYVFLSGTREPQQKKDLAPSQPKPAAKVQELPKVEDRTAERVKKFVDELGKARFEDHEKTVQSVMDIELEIKDAALLKQIDDAYAKYTEAYEAAAKQEFQTVVKDAGDLANRGMFADAAKRLEAFPEHFRKSKHYPEIEGMLESYAAFQKSLRDIDDALAEAKKLAGDFKEHKRALEYFQFAADIAEKLPPQIDRKGEIASERKKFEEAFDAASKQAHDAALKAVDECGTDYKKGIEALDAFPQHFAGTKYAAEITVRKEQLVKLYGVEGTVNDALAKIQQDTFDYTLFSDHEANLARFDEISKIAAERADLSEKIAGERKKYEAAFNKSCADYFSDIKKRAQTEITKKEYAKALEILEEFPKWFAKTKQGAEIQKMKDEVGKKVSVAPKPAVPQEEQIEKDVRALNESIDKLSHDEKHSTDLVKKFKANLKLTVVWPAGAPAKTTRDARGNEKPLTGDGAANWFKYNDAGSWKEFDVKKGTWYLIQCKGDECPRGGGSLGCVTFSIQEQSGSEWKDMKKIEGPQHICWYYFAAYKPSSAKIRIDAKTGFYVTVYDVTK